jgi:alkylation response protein AidB-like acyl-CoA dehydrogenase
MDLSPTPAQDGFRRELREWLRANLPWEYGVGLPPRFTDLDEEVAFLRAWQAKLAAGRWVGVAWPEEHGGRGTGPAEHYIVQEELARARAPELVGRIGINLAGPTLLAHGSEEQKARWLTRILSADDLWCQLFSEPGAGSDLASVSTAATHADGGWVLNGQKVWTSYAQFADWGICLARTDPDAPKHKGISYLVVDMRAPGVEVRPLVQLTGEAEFNEVFLTDVFVPRHQLIGEENNGWRVASSTLSHERGTSPRQLVIHTQLLEELLRMAVGRGGFDDRRTREPGPEGSALKLYWSEMTKRLHDTAMAVLGAASPLWKGATDNPGDGVWQRSWLYYQAASIFAGTNEIQRNIVGERVLGLPREPVAT